MGCSYMLRGRQGEERGRRFETSDVIVPKITISPNNYSDIQCGRHALLCRTRERLMTERKRFPQKHHASPALGQPPRETGRGVWPEI